MASISYFVGVVIDRNRDRDIERLIRSIAVQRGIQGTRLGIGIKSNDGRDYSSLVRSILQMCEVTNPIEVLSADERSYHSIGASHNILSELAIERNYGKYLGLKPGGLLHHAAIFHLTEKWQACHEHSIVEMRIFPKEHPKIYDPATGETGWCSGTCFSISPQTLKLHGGFDENLGLYFEDVDLSWRLRMTGQNCYLAPKALYFYDLSDDSISHFTQVEMLKSGRCLGKKWKNQSFQLSMEEQLAKLGMRETEVGRPDTATVQVEYSDKELASVCEFGRGFNFSTARW